MKIALLYSLVLASVFVVEAGDFCALNAEKRSSTLHCLGEKLAPEVKGKLLALNQEGSPIGEFVKKHCDKGTDYVEVLKKNPECTRTCIFEEGLRRVHCLDEALNDYWAEI
uniref:Putative secreted protein n=1 Tax=Ixodes ricinus TaxID=34613 RepID=A0A090X9B6_IXORI